MRNMALCIFYAAMFGGAAMAQTNDLKVGQAFGGWVFRCNAIGQDKTSCAFVSTVLSEDKKHAVAAVNVNRASTGKGYALSVLLPLGVDIQAGVKSAVDDGATIDLPLRVCTVNGCVAATTMDDKAADALKKGKNLTVQFNFGDKSAKATVPLAGLKDALAAANW